MIMKEDVIPKFSKNDYSGGILQAVATISDAITSQEGGPAGEAPTSIVLTKNFAPITDTANAIKPETKKIITDLSNEINKKTGVELGVLTLDSMGKEDIAAYANRTTEAWKAAKPGKTDIILIVAAVKDHKLHIYAGPGMKKLVTDEAATDIQNKQIVPWFLNNDYGNGLLNGMRAIAQLLAKDQKIQLSGLAKLAPPPPLPKEGTTAAGEPGTTQTSSASTIQIPPHATKAPEFKETAPAKAAGNGQLIFVVGIVILIVVFVGILINQIRKGSGQGPGKEDK